MDQEVDVELFITCRLCLDEPGSYQIVPWIKAQITYCFGIEINPFDGLPQLICKKCKGILTEYYTTKNAFLEKQRKLHNKPKDNNDSQSSILPTTESVNPPTADVAPDDNTEKLLSALAKSEKAAGATDVTPHGNNSVKSAVKTTNTKKKPSWKNNFNKYLVCTICNKSFLTEKSVKRHLPMHKKIISRHEKLFKNYLTVRLNKIDEKKNSTGSLHNVVYNKDKIICERRNSKYHSFYLKKAFTTNDETDENENVAVKRPMVLSDSSDDEIIKGKKRKTRRLFSTSSTQTVILEENAEPVDRGNADHQSNPNGMVIINADYINLDDTSSDCPKTNSELEKKRILPKRQQVKAEVGDYKAIQNIVTMCHKNYIKKIQIDTDALNKSTFSESSLKHKVLSLGRKVINKQGFSCTGLLRFMEHKDLDIIWTPTSNEMQKKGSNFVRIMTKLKSREDSENDDACWKNLQDISFCRDSGVEARVASTSETSRSVDQAGPPPAISDEDPTLASAPCETNDLNYRNKLLNKTPVANPKQLPKKSLPEIKPVIVKANDATLTSPNLISEAVEEADVEDSNMCLPIITSTTSLSVLVSEKENQEVPVLEKPAPRIKVKPASELMSARALNNQETAEEVWTFNPIKSSLPHHLADTAVTVEAPMTESHGVFVSSQPSATFGLVAYQNDTQSQVGENNRKEAPQRNHEFITLDSPQFPNTKTKAPFQYFRKILLVFGLKLLDLNEDLPQHFNCLIKFKLMLRQDTKRPIGVLLSLFCSEDTFCFNFKDTNSKIFDPNQLNAFWQWELLKIYKGDVVDRILQNAMKVGKEVHEYTKLFLCLLNSINLITED